MSTCLRADSINAFFDKYVHKKTSVQEFVKLYDTIMQDRCEEEAKADSETWNKQPAMKSPSPFEKSVFEVYTPAVFKKFHLEVLGAIACSPREESRDATCSTFKGQDFKNNQDFVYILKRWTKDAKSRHFSVEPQQLQTRLQRYKDLCQLALKLNEEASFSQESYNIAFLAIEEALGNCAGANTSGKVFKMWSRHQL